MKRTLVAKCAAALVGGFALAGAHAAVVGPDAPASAPTLNTGVPAATKLEINTDGVGHILFVPYYSAQNGNVTLLNIVNTDVRNAKAVKVRFRGASNSDDVFDFTLLLSPGDVWAAGVSQSAAGVAQLVTADNTCTLPNGVGKASDGLKQFVTARLNTALAAADLQAETREGYVEILNMADIPVNATTSSLYASIKHGTNGSPLNCNSTTVNALFNDPTSYADAVSKGLEVPTSGLMANWTVINGPSSQAWSGAAVAVEARTDDGLTPGRGNIVLFPQTGAAVAVANAKAFTSDPLLRGGFTAATFQAAVTGNDGTPAFPSAALAAVAAANYDFPDLSTPYLNADLTAGVLVSANGIHARRQAHRLTTAIASTSTTNEFVTDQTILAKTDWVFSLPTRRYNVARFYGGTVSDGTTTAAATNVFTNLVRDDADTLVQYAVPFSSYTTAPPFATLVAGQATTVTAFNFFDTTNTASSTTAGKTHQICVSGISYKGGAVVAPTSVANDLANRKAATTGNREEAFAANSSDFVISPSQPAPGLSFCGEVSVLTFNAGTFGNGALKAVVAGQDVVPSYTDGWMRIATPGLDSQGLPVVGSAIMKYTNSAASAGVAANYGVAFPHRVTRY